MRFASAPDLFESSSVRFGSVRKMMFPGSTRFGFRFPDASWLGPVRFGSVQRPVLAGSRIERFGSVRPVRFGFLFLPASTAEPGSGGRSTLGRASGWREPFAILSDAQGGSSWRPEGRNEAGPFFVGEADILACRRNKARSVACSSLQLRSPTMFRGLLDKCPEGTKRATFVNVQLLRLGRDLRTGSISRDIVNFPSELCKQKWCVYGGRTFGAA